MNRQMKFRVWDKVRKEFVKYASGGFGWPDLSEIRITLEGNLRIEEEYGKATLDKDRYILQQYTGLKDINDKEICEGDIVEGTCEFDEMDFHGNVKCKDYGFTGDVVYDNGAFRCDEADFPLECYELKVIGHILQ
jgi:uncharacterized phage protein (TIGR01671 family)